MFGESLRRRAKRLVREIGHWRTRTRNNTRREKPEENEYVGHGEISEVEKTIDSPLVLLADCIAGWLTSITAREQILFLSSYTFEFDKGFRLTDLF